MKLVSKILLVLLAVVGLDAAAGFALYRHLVFAAAHAWCVLTAQTRYERKRCAYRVYYSRRIWTFIALLTGLAAGYVTYDALRSSSRRR